MVATEIAVALTWNQLADFYDSFHPGSRPARTLRMETVFAWAEAHPETFYLGEDDCLYLRTEIKNA